MVSLPSNPYGKDSIDQAAHAAFQEYVLREMYRLKLQAWPDPQNPFQTNGAFYDRNVPLVYTICEDEGKHLFVTLGKIGKTPTIEDLPERERLHVMYGGEVLTSEEMRAYAVRDHAANVLREHLNNLGVRVEERRGWEIPMDEEMLRKEIERLTK